MDTKTNIIRVLFIVLCIVILAIAPIGYAYFLEQRAIKTLRVSTANPAVEGKTAKRIIAKVARAEKIPKNEAPTVVLVTDPSILLPFGKLMPGDFILLYHKSDLAVVFDEISGRIINAVPVNIKKPHAK